MKGVTVLQLAAMTASVIAFASLLSWHLVLEQQAWVAHRDGLQAATHAARAIMLAAKVRIEPGWVDLGNSGSPLGWSRGTWVQSTEQLRRSNYVDIHGVHQHHIHHKSGHKSCETKHSY